MGQGWLAGESREKFRIPGEVAEALPTAGKMPALGAVNGLGL